MYCFNIKQLPAQSSLISDLKCMTSQMDSLLASHDHIVQNDTLLEARNSMNHLKQSDFNQTCLLSFALHVPEWSLPCSLTDFVPCDC